VHIYAAGADLSNAVPTLSGPIDVGRHAPCVPIACSRVITRGTTCQNLLSRREVATDRPTPGTRRSCRVLSMAIRRGGMALEAPVGRSGVARDPRATNPFDDQTRQLYIARARVTGQR
jgi:hypothetical protein